GKAWYSSYENCTLTQTIDLIGKGFSPQVLDKFPPINAGVYVYTNNSSAGTITIKAELLGESESVLKTVYISNNEVIPINTDWTLKSAAIREYGTGLRKIRFTLVGKDAVGWRGQYGPEFDNAYVNFDIRDIRSAVSIVDVPAISFYPNPAKSEFTIDAGVQSTTVSVYDLKGRLLISQQATPKTHINITSFPNGVYMVKANGLIGKLIKN
ncbi:MAG TPA: T9SS type A sorting domain-containing protein, partial [Paludibacter sp.]|nr:T9SS type A sorting domain-containing protein [Paludibacter sp.]